MIGQINRHRFFASCSLHSSWPFALLLILLRISTSSHQSPVAHTPPSSIIPSPQLPPSAHCSCSCSCTCLLACLLASFRHFVPAIAASSPAAEDVALICALLQRTANQTQRDARRPGITTSASPLLAIFKLPGTAHSGSSAVCWTRLRIRTSSHRYACDGRRANCDISHSEAGLFGLSAAHDLYESSSAASTLRLSVRRQFAASTTPLLRQLAERILFLCNLCNLYLNNH